MIAPIQNVFELSALATMPKWREQSYIGEKQQIRAIAKDAGLFLRPSTPRMAVDGCMGW